MERKIKEIGGLRGAEMALTRHGRGDDMVATMVRSTVAACVVIGGGVSGVLWLGRGADDVRRLTAVQLVAGHRLRGDLTAARGGRVRRLRRGICMAWRHVARREGGGMRGGVRAL
jgi:hypothetical protein